MSDMMNRPRCDECPLDNKRGRKYVVPQQPTGQANGLFIIGEQPSSEDARDSVPLVDEAGRLLDSVLKTAGINRNECFVSNAIACFNRTIELSDREKIKAVAACRPRLLHELQIINPKLIYMLGGAAVRSVLSDKWQAGVDDLRGAMLRSNLVDMCADDIPKNALAMCSYHPTRILNGGGQELDILLADTWKVSNWLRQAPPPWVDQYILAPKADVLSALFDHWFEKFGSVAVDVETTGRMNRWLCDLRMIGIGWTDKAAVIPTAEAEWREFYTSSEYLDVCSLIRKYLASPGVSKIFHNLQFDIPVLLRHGFEVHGMSHDTLEAHFALYHKGVRHGLGFVAQQYLDVPPWKVLHDGDHEATGIVEEAIYNSRDIRTTATIWEVIYPELVKEGLWNTYLMGIENNQNAWRLSHAGFHVDPERHKNAIDTWQNNRVMSYAKLLKEANVGERQTQLVKDMASLKTEALLTAKSDALVNGDITIDDITALTRVMERTVSLVTHKKGQRELADTMESILEHHRHVFDPMSRLMAIERIKSIVKLAKKSKEAIPASVLTAFNTNAKTAIEDPEELKTLKAADWVEHTKVLRQPVTRLAQLTKAGMVRLRKQVFRYPFVNFHSAYEAGIVIHDANWFALPVQSAPNSKGEYTVDKEALSHIKGHPVVKTYREMKSAHKRWTRLTEFPIYPDGRIHPVFKTHDISGRWSSGDSHGDPLDVYNAQNEEAMFMDIFTAPPKCKYIGADFSGLELRVVAVQTGCRTLIDQFERYDAGKDLKVHAQTARLIWRDYSHLPLDQQRQHYESGKRYKIAKSGGFLIVYGGAEDTLADKIIAEEPYETDLQKRKDRDADIREECRALFRVLRVSWAEIFENRKAWYDEACRTGRLQTGWLTGRFLRFPLRDKDHISPTLCANAPVQTTAGEIAHRALSKIIHGLPEGCRVVLYIHDCIIVEAPEHLAEWVRDFMKQSMEYKFDGPAGSLMCLAEPKIGDNLAEVK